MITLLNGNMEIMTRINEKLFLHYILLSVSQVNLCCPVTSWARFIDCLIISGHLDERNWMVTSHFINIPVPLQLITTKVMVQCTAGNQPVTYQTQWTDPLKAKRNTEHQLIGVVLISCTVNICKSVRNAVRAKTF